MRDGPIQITAREAEEVAQRLLQCVQQADTDLAQYNTAVDEGRALFEPRPTRADKPWDGATEAHMPLCEMTRAQQLAKTDRALLCVEPILHVEEFSPQERDLARRVESFFQHLLTEVLHFRNSFLPVIDSALTDGSALVYLVWRQEYRDVRRWQTVPVPDPKLPEDAAAGEDGFTYLPDGFDGWMPHTDETGQPVPYYVEKRQGVTETVLAYDSPELIHVETGYVPDTDKARWGTYPARNANVQRSTGVFVRYEATGDDLLQRVAAGAFDREAVTSLRTASGTGEHGQTPTDEIEEIGGDTEADPAFQWKRFGLIDLVWRYMQLAPSGEVENDDTQKRRDLRRPVDWIFTLDEDSMKMLQARPLRDVWWNGERPFVLARPFRKRFGVHGTSTADLVGDFQDTMTRMIWAACDAAQLQTDPPLKFLKGEVVDPRSRQRILKEKKPGGGVDVDRMDAVAQLLEVIGNPDTSLKWFEQMKDLAQFNAFTSDQDSGAIPGKATATEVNVATAKGDVLMGHVVENIADDTIEEIGRLLQALCYQYIGNESVQGWWKQANPDAAPPDPQFLPGEYELGLKYKLRAWGTTEAGNRSLVQQRWAAVFQLVKTLGELAPMPDDTPEMAEAKAHLEYAADRAFIAAMGLTANPTELLGTEDDFVARRVQQAQLRMQALMLQMGMQQQAQEQQAAEGEAQRQQQAQESEQGRQFQAQSAQQAHERDLEKMMAEAALQSQPQPAGAAQ